MTVRELKEILNAFPDDYHIFIQIDGGRILHITNVIEDSIDPDDNKRFAVII